MQCRNAPFINCRCFAIQSLTGRERRQVHVTSSGRLLARLLSVLGHKPTFTKSSSQKGRPPCGCLIEIRYDFYQTANVATGFLPRQPSRPSLESIANLVQSGPSAIIVKFTSRGTSGTNGTDRFFSKLNYHATRNKKYVRDLG